MLGLGCGAGKGVSPPPKGETLLTHTHSEPRCHPLLSPFEFTALVLLPFSVHSLQCKCNSERENMNVGDQGLHEQSPIFLYCSDWKIELSKNHERIDLPGPRRKRRPEKGGKLNTSQAGSVAASRAAIGQFLSLFRVAFRLATRYSDAEAIHAVMFL